MFYVNDKIIPKDRQIEYEIANTIKNGNVIDLPYIEEICPACAIRKNLSDAHCYRCKGCFKNKFFHSNIFQICITKYNIKRYLLYVLLKINFYFICLCNCVNKNPTNKNLLSFLVIFRYKTEISNIFMELIVGFFLFKEIGHFISMIICLSVKTPYQFIFKYHKKIYPNTLKETGQKNVLQYPEINENISIKNAIKNIINNIC